MVELIGQLTTEELARWRMVQARLEAVRLRPDAFSAKEIEAALLDDWNLSAECVERYGIDDTRSWAINATTGTIFYHED